MTDELTTPAIETTAEYETIWTATAQVLRSQVSEAVWFSTFNDAVPVFDNKMSLRLRVPNSFVRDRIVNC